MTLSGANLSVDASGQYGDIRGLSKAQRQVMGEFFKGWRRKTGVVTLAIACMFMAAWVRSTISGDEVTYASGATSCRIIALVDGHLAWLSFDDIRPTLVPKFPYWSAESFQKFDKFYNGKSKTWNWRFCGFAVGTAQNPGKTTIFVVSFCSIVIPLTLLSGYLLLAKPRPAKPVPAKPKESP